MAKKSSIEKNNRRRALVAQYEERRTQLKAIINSKQAPFEERMAAQKKLSSFPRNASPVRIRNRCELTGRPRGFLGDFKLSRIKFREMALLGYLPGVKKTSW